MTDDSDDGVEWMEPVDDEILELLRDEDVFMPDQIADEVEPRSPQVAYRCRELVSHGLATKLATGMYDISENGERYLEGDLEPSDLADES